MSARAQGDGPRACEVLLVEDNPADARLVAECLRDSRQPFRVHVVENGDDALAYLRREGRFEGAPRPDLILIDLNLPGTGGGEVLDTVKRHPDWKSIRVVVLTSSQSAVDVRASLERRADGFLTKPIDLAGYDRIARSIEAYWVPKAGRPGD